MTVLKKFEIKAEHPDDFITAMIKNSADTILSCVKKQRSYLQKPKLEAAELINVFEQIGLKKTSAFLQKNIALV